MSEPRGGIGLAGIAVIAIACCIGLPLLAAVGVSAVALVGGIAAGGLALIAASVLIVRSFRTRRETT